MSVKIAKYCTLFFIVFVSLFSLTSFNEENKYETCFGISLNPNYGSLFTFAILEMRNEKVFKKEFITRERFVMMTIGLMDSKVNPYNENLLKSHGIMNCSDGTNIIFEPPCEECDVVNNLWKLRFGEWPYLDTTQMDQPALKGWASGSYFPSEGQRNMLYNEFNIGHINDFIKGENVFKLLKKMEDHSWVSRYQGAN